MAKQKLSKHFLTGDDPLPISSDEDALGFKSLAISIADALASRIDADGYILGIEGKWGSGKSTLANYIVGALDKKYKNCQIIPFEPWLIRNEDALTSLLLEKIATKIDEQSQLARAEKTFKAVAKEVSSNIRAFSKGAKFAAIVAGKLLGGQQGADLAASAVGLSEVADTADEFIKEVKRAASLEKQKNDVKKGLRKIGEINQKLRFVVIIDDLDRLEPNEALEILRLVRKVADFPLVTYLLCFDRRALARQIKKAAKLKDGHAYLEKIFQSIIGIPPAEPFALRKLLRHKLEAIFPGEMLSKVDEKADDEHRRELLLDIWVGKLIETPRDVARLIDAIKWGWITIQKHADFIDYVWLQLIKLKAFPLYEWTQNYVMEIGAFRDHGKPSDENTKLAKNLSCILAIYGWNDKHYLSGIDYFLPGVRAAFLNSEKRKVFDFNTGELESFENAYRLGSPTHWRIYFAYELPSYALSDQEVIQFRKACAQFDKKPKAAPKIIRKLYEREYNRPGHYVEYLFTRVNDQIASQSNFSKEEFAGLLHSFVEILDDLGRVTPDFKFTGNNPIWNKAESIIERGGRFLDTNFTDTLMLSLAAKGKSLNWLTGLIRIQAWVHGLAKGRADTDRQFMSKEAVLRAVEILQSRFEKLNASSLAKLPQALDIVFCWSQLGDHEALLKFFARITESDINFVDAIGALGSWSLSSNEGVKHPINRTYVMLVMDADHAKERLEKIAKLESALSKKAKKLLGSWSDRE